MRKLTGFVHVHDDKGNSRVYGPGDDVPADVAKRITNPDAWESDDEGDGEPSESWTVADLKAYAEQREIDLGDATKKADILAAIQAADDDNPAV
ncbi:hypothetical protein [Nocardia brasiliensis]|uniref:hypothetical protein n=1 Tax=Nocardia brasiliensis TaxID=37326 RepID=UPI0024585FE4|nr:hypothetical protein [Nocardia brasiliensis]